MSGLLITAAVLAFAVGLISLILWADYRDEQADKRWHERWDRP